MILIDDATRVCYVYLLRTKDEALDYFSSTVFLVAGVNFSKYFLLSAI
jgi:hypothetical protein